MKRIADLVAEHPLFADLDATETQLITPLHDATTDGIDACIAFFQRLARLKQHEPGSHGCLMVNTMTELGTTDPDLAPRARRYHTALRTGFESALLRVAPVHGIPPHAAETLVALAMTINLHARTGNIAGVRSTNQAARSLLASWQGTVRESLDQGVRKRRPRRA